MLAMLRDQGTGVRGKVIATLGLLIAHFGAWLAALAAFRDRPVLLGTALLAYSFGLRHAVDADHIAAIDNVTRKLMQEGKRPVAVGLCFSLGHSLVLVIGTIIVAVTVMKLHAGFSAFNDAANLVGTLVSAVFLLAMAIMNLLIARSVYKTYRHVRKGGAYDESDFDLLLNNRGLIARVVRPLFRLVSHSWQMLPIGFLFGLGFDTTVLNHREDRSRIAQA